MTKTSGSLHKSSFLLACRLSLHLGQYLYQIQINIILAIDIQVLILYMQMQKCFKNYFCSSYTVLLIKRFQQQYKIKQEKKKKSEQNYKVKKQISSYPKVEIDIKTIFYNVCVSHSLKDITLRIEINNTQTSNNRASIRCVHKGGAC